MKRRKISLMLTVALIFTVIPVFNNTSNIVKADTVSGVSTSSSTETKQTKTLLDMNFDDVAEGTKADNLGFKVVSPPTGYSGEAYVKQNPDGNGKSLYMSDNCADRSVNTNTETVSYNFEPMADGIVTAEVRFRQDAEERERMGIMNLVDSDGNFLVRMITDPSTEAISLLPKAAPYKFLHYNVGEWYTVKVKVDIKLNMMSIYVNDKLVWNRRPTVGVCKDFAGIQMYTPGNSSTENPGQYFDYVKVNWESSNGPAKPQNLVGYSANNKVTLTFDPVLQASSSNVAIRVDSPPQDYHVGYEAWISDDPNAEFYDGYLVPNNGDDRPDNVNLGQNWSYGAPIAGKNIWTLSNTVRTCTALKESITLTNKFFLQMDGSDKNKVINKIKTDPTKADLLAMLQDSTSKLQNGKTYYVKLRALDKNGVAGPFSDVIAVTPALSTKVPVDSSSIMQDLTLFDTENVGNYQIETDVNSGDNVYTSTIDSTEAFDTVPAAYVNKQWIIPDWKSRTFGKDRSSGIDDRMMNFTVKDDSEVYVAMDTRALTDAAIVNMPNQWIKTEGFTKLDGQTIESDDATGPITYQIFEKDFKAGDKVELKSMLNSGAAPVGNSYFVMMNMKTYGLNISDVRKEVSNEDLKISGSITRPAYVDITVNGQTVQSNTYAASLSFSKDVKLVKGNNKIQVKAYNVDGFAQEYDYDVIYNTDGPKATVNTIDSMVTNRNVVVDGTSEKDGVVKVTINSKEVANVNVKANEEFKIPVVLNDGSNKVDIQVYDGIGNVTDFAYNTNLLLWNKTVELKNSSSAGTINAGDFISSDAKILNQTNGDKNSKLIIAFYDKNNTMIDFISAQAILSQDSDGELSSDIKVPNNTVKIKSFIWSGEDDVMPSSDAYTLQ
jgi:hypothetical protein